MVGCVLKLDNITFTVTHRVLRQGLSTIELSGFQYRLDHFGKINFNKLSIAIRCVYLDQDAKYKRPVVEPSASFEQTNNRQTNLTQLASVSVSKVQQKARRKTSENGAKLHSATANYTLRQMGLRV